MNDDKVLRQTVRSSRRAPRAFVAESGSVPTILRERMRARRRDKGVPESLDLATRITRMDKAIAFHEQRLEQMKLRRADLNAKHIEAESLESKIPEPLESAVPEPVKSNKPKRERRKKD
jgi:hypothetical protein